MVLVPLAWQIKQTGAEDVKQRFDDIREALEKGMITQEEYKMHMIQLGRESRELTAVTRTQKQVFEATHPSIVSFGRAMSAVTGVFHAAASGLALINLAQLTMQGTSAALAEATINAEKAHRNYTDAVNEFGEDSPQAKEALAEWNVETAKANELADQMDQQKAGNIINMGVAIGLMGSSIARSVKSIPDFINGFKGVSDAIKKFGVARTAGLVAIGAGATLLATGGVDALIGTSEKLEDKLKAVAGVGLVGVGIALAVPEIAKIALIGTAIATAATAIIVFRKELEPLWNFLVETFGTVAGAIWVAFQTAVAVALQTVTDAWKTFVDVLTAIWDSITTGFAAFWNGMATMTQSAINGIIGGVESFANGIIDTINGIIKAYNALPKELRVFGKATIIGHVSIPRVSIPMIAAATGFQGMVTKPTLFLAGEAGAEPVMIGGSDTSVSSTSNNFNSGGATFVQIVHGSLLYEREAYHLMAGYQKREFQRRNFRPPV